MNPLSIRTLTNMIADEKDGYNKVTNTPPVTRKARRASKKVRK